MKALQERIKEFENQGWEYQKEFRLHVKGNTLVQFEALTKGNEYRKLAKGKIYTVKNINAEVER